MRVLTNLILLAGGLLLVLNQLDISETFTVVDPDPPTADTAAPPSPPELVGIRQLSPPSLWSKASMYLSQDGQILYDIIEACEIRQVRPHAARLVKAENKGYFNLGAACDVYDHLRARWSYLSDAPSDDHAAPATESLQLMTGDCDDYATLQAAMLWSIGAHIRILHAAGPEGGHAFTQLNIGQTPLKDIAHYICYRYNLPGIRLHYDTDELGNRWLNLDYFYDHRSHPGSPIYDYDYAKCFYPQYERLTHYHKSNNR